MIIFNNSHSGGRLSSIAGKHFCFTELSPDRNAKVLSGQTGGSGKEKPVNSQLPLTINLETGTDIFYDLVNSLG